MLIHPRQLLQCNNIGHNLHAQNVGPNMNWSWPIIIKDILVANNCRLFHVGIGVCFMQLANGCGFALERAPLNTKKPALHLCKGMKSKSDLISALICLTTPGILVSCCWQWIVSTIRRCISCQLELYRSGLAALKNAHKRIYTYGCLPSGYMGNYAHNHLFLQRCSIFFLQDNTAKLEIISFVQKTPPIRQYRKHLWVRGFSWLWYRV